MFDQLVVSGNQSGTNKPWTVAVSAIFQFVLLGIAFSDSAYLHGGTAQGHAEYVSRRSAPSSASATPST